MFKKFKPAYIYTSIDDIDIKMLCSSGIRAVILDIDNTLVPPHTPVADTRAAGFVKALKDEGLKLCIVSNNIYERAEKFASSLELPFVCDKNKPAAKPFLMAMEILGEKAEHTAVVGDQLFTDVWGANRMRMVPVLVSPMSKNENAFIKFKRLLEKAVMKCIK